MRRAILLLAMVGLGLMLATGVALAVSGAFTGTNKSQTINGSNGQDRIAGGGGNDTINARTNGDELYGDFGADTLNGNNGDDQLYGGSGADKLNGEDDDDFINAADRSGGDTVNGGGGNDTCVVDPGDIIGTTTVGNTTPAPSQACENPTLVP